MKKYLSVFLVLLMLMICFLPFDAFASDIERDNVSFTQEDFEMLEHRDADYIEPLATGLIKDRSLRITKSGNNLLISGSTKGTSAVVKCGFNKVIVQRKKATSSSWSDYKTYKDLYSNSNYYKLNKSVSVEKGYQYRVTATHYAKKSLLSIQKVSATTGYLSF